MELSVKEICITLKTELNRFDSINPKIEIILKGIKKK